MFLAEIASGVLISEAVTFCSVRVDQSFLFGLIPALALNCDAVHCESGM